jgi:very-short-patch-repair endonuclease
MSSSKLIIKDYDLTASKLMNNDFECKICGRNFSGGTYINNHILAKHNINLKTYLLRYFDIDVDKINEEWDSKKEERRKKQLQGLMNAAKANKGKSIKEKLGEEGYGNFLKSMKGVFSLEWFVEKYGEKEGKKKHKDRSISLSKNTHWIKFNKENKKNWSNISQKLFWEIYHLIKHKYDHIYFGELNHEFSCGLQSQNFDFVIRDIKKIIEFNGDKFHGNPEIYESSDIPLKFLGITAGEIWNNDKNKINKAKNNGYSVLIIWESEYLKNKENTILKCINFIENYENS